MEEATTLAAYSCGPNKVSFSDRECCIRRAPDIRMSSRKVAGPENSRGSREYNPFPSLNTSSSKIIPPFPVPNTWLGFYHPCWQAYLQHFKLKVSPSKDMLQPTHSSDLWGEGDSRKEEKSHLYLSYCNMKQSKTNTACPVTSTQALRLVFPECMSWCF